MMGAAVLSEMLKLRRSGLWWSTLLAFTVAAGAGALFVFIGQDPDRARSLGLLGAKAQLGQVTADWPGHLALLGQITAVGGLLVFGVVAIWIFGREFSDHTVKDLLALPTARGTIVLAKFAVAAGWSLALTGYLFILGLLAGALLDLPGWTGATAVDGFARLFGTAAMTTALTTPFGFAASLGRGYLPAIAAMFVALFCAQLIAALGYGAYFPWSVPALYSDVAGPDTAAPGPWSVAAVAVTGLAAVLATTRWWQRADHTT